METVIDVVDGPDLVTVDEQIQEMERGTMNERLLASALRLAQSLGFEVSLGTGRWNSVVVHLGEQRFERDTEARMARDVIDACTATIRSRRGA